MRLAVPVSVEGYFGYSFLARSTSTVFIRYLHENKVNDAVNDDIIISRGLLSTGTSRPTFY